MPVLNTHAPVHRQATALVGRNDPRAGQQADGRLRVASATAGIRLVDDGGAQKLLTAHPALSTLPDQEQASLLRRSRPRVLRRHDVVLRRGDPAGAVVIVLQGYLKFSTMLASGDEVVLDVVGPCDSRLELNALLGWPVSADLVALSACQLLMIDARYFRQAFEGRPDGLLAILRLANQRLEEVTAHRVDHHSLNAEGRLAKLLMRLARLQSSCAGDPAWLPLRLSQGELGAMSGMSREFVNKYLRVWRDAGWIRMTGGNVTSIDVAALAEVSGTQEDDDVPSKPVAASSCR